MREGQDITSLDIYGEPVRVRIFVSGTYHNFQATMDGADYSDKTIDGLEKKLKAHAKGKRKRLDINVMIEVYGEPTPGTITSKNAKSGKLRVSFKKHGSSSWDEFYSHHDFFRPMSTEEIAHYKRLSNAVRQATDELGKFKRSLKLDVDRIIRDMERQTEAEVEKEAQDAKSESNA